MQASILAALALRLAAPSAVAADHDTDHAVHCMARVVRMQAADPSVSAAAALVMLYWLGRMDGQSPPTDIAAALRKTDRLSDDELKQRTEDCDRVFTLRAKAMVAATEGAKKPVPTPRP